MEITLDGAIFGIFLIFNLIVGLFYSTNIKNIREYAVGNKDFSTATLSATIIATCIGGGFFSGAITESYRQGLYFIIPSLGEPLALIVTGYFLAPRMNEFLGTLSVAEALGSLYGKLVQRISALSSIFLCVGIVALQFKVAGTIMAVFFGVSSFHAVLISAIVVIIYSTFGGIKAVTFTDVIQFFTFGTIVPIISFIIWGTFKDPYAAFSALQTNPLLSFSHVFDIHNVKFWNSVFLLLFFLIPEMQPVFYQRIVMAKNAFQARKSFMIAGSITLLMLLITIWVGVLLLSDNPNLEPNNLLAYIIEKYSYPGLKGLTAIGIMAIIMSTADSYINTAAVIFANDLIGISNESRAKDANLTIPRIFAVIVGVAAFFLAFKASSILNLLIFVLSFYGPVVSVGLVLAILGFRTTTPCILMGMTAGVATVFFLNFVELGLDGFVPGMAANLLMVLFSHYTLGQPGGWVGIKDYSVIEQLRSDRKRKFREIGNKIINFSFIEFSKNNKPANEGMYSLFGFFCIISIFSTMYSLSPELRHRFDELLTVIYNIILVYSSIFLTYSVWPKRLKSETFISIAWTIGVPFILVFSHSLLVIISNFGQLQLMIFMVNQIVIAILLRWNVAIFSSLMAVLCSFVYFNNSSFHTIDFNIDLQFKIVYIMLLFSSVLIAFFKPFQDHQASTEAKVEMLNHQVLDREIEMMKALELKHEFLRNINHEIRTPVMGVTSIAQELDLSWDKLSNDERKQYTKIVAKSSDRLVSFVKNILDFSKLSSNKLELNLSKFNISNLLEDRIEACQKTYSEGQNIEIIRDIKNDLNIKADKYYISELIDNIIINAIKYSNGGEIRVKLSSNTKAKKKFIEIVISDNGIGIPQEDLNSIFEPFSTGSKTRSYAGGRGMGLAVCKKIIETHNGEIKADSDGISGSVFTILLPVA